MWYYISTLIALYLDYIVLNRQYVYIEREDKEEKVKHPLIMHISVYILTLIPLVGLFCPLLMALYDGWQIEDKYRHANRIFKHVLFKNF